jgi:hypothetical protein
VHHVAASDIFVTVHVSAALRALRIEAYGVSSLATAGRPARRIEFRQAGCIHILRGRGCKQQIDPLQYPGTRSLFALSLDPEESWNNPYGRNFLRRFCSKIFCSATTDTWYMVEVPCWTPCLCRPDWPPPRRMEDRNFNIYVSNIGLSNASAVYDCFNPHSSHIINHINRTSIRVQRVMCGPVPSQDWYPPKPVLLVAENRHLSIKNYFS